ncbi:MAG: sigma-70 family RNA polymerase sigma factor [Verrucomicrobia bacterium]|nr:sigma-70 family RNA polymerase sigma factor [Verrucomicrobiota bacterium]
MPASASTLARRLLAQRQAFRSFLAARLGNAADADDLLQHGLVKALRQAPELKEEEKAVAWFYQILRRAAVDFRRSRTAARRREQAWTEDFMALSANDATAARAVCACLDHVISTLKPSQAHLLRLVEWQGASVAAAAAELGLTPNHASVALHRARQELRRKLLEFCGECARGKCLDCDCPPENPRQPATTAKATQSASRRPRVPPP